MFSFYAYPILIFHACIPIGVVIHPVDVSLAAGGGDADERRARRHVLRGYEGFVDDAAPCMVGDYLAGVAVGGGEVNGLHAFAVCRNRDGVDIAGFEGCQGADRNYGRVV